MLNKKWIETASLFPELDQKLIDLLKGLSPGDWNHSTRFPAWKVKDIAVHLLDTSIRRLSSQRDCYHSDLKLSISSYSELVQYITALADRWSAAFTSVSPRIIIELLEIYQNQLTAFLTELDPLGRAHFSVAWAGEEESLNWFDIAREYTERWLHQMQIRDVLNKEPLYEKHLYYPLLDTFMQALPYHFQSVESKEGYIFCAAITGESGGKWFLRRNGNTWELEYDIREKPDTSVVIENAAAWKIFSKWNSEESLTNEIRITGDERLGRHLLKMICVMI